MQRELVGFVQASGAGWREDSSNAGDGYGRNKVRHHLVPLLASMVGACAQISLSLLDFPAICEFPKLTESHHDLRTAIIVLQKKCIILILDIFVSPRTT